jgi:uncharacterized protein (DUF2147 family)
MNPAIKHYLAWLAIASSTVLAQAPVLTNSPVGLWQSIDDTTGKPRAQIRISDMGGVLTGRIVASSSPTQPGTVQVCERCSDERKNQPLIGMEMIRNMRQQGDQALWAGGEILDPDKGSSYRLQLSLLDAGKKLQVRGYIGPFFRNQTWLRLE